MIGRDGWFDFPTAATFPGLDKAMAYALAFAKEQGAAGVRGARIDVRARGGSRGRGRTLATYKSDDYRSALPPEPMA